MALQKQLHFLSQSSSNTAFGLNRFTVKLMVIYKGENKKGYFGVFLEVPLSWVHVHSQKSKFLLKAYFLMLYFYLKK